MVIDPRAWNAALLVIPGHRVGDRDYLPEPSARIARPVWQEPNATVLELEDVVDRDIVTVPLRIVEEDPVQQAFPLGLGSAEREPGGRTRDRHVPDVHGLTRTRVGHDRAVELRNGCVNSGAAGFRSVAEMVWPPPSTVVMVLGTVMELVTSPQSAVNV